MGLDLKAYVTVPLGALVMQQEAKEARYLELFAALPASARSLVTAPQTGAYVRGLARNHNVSLAEAWRIAALVLDVVLGEKQIASLPSALAAALALPAATAQRMADEITRDLIGPLRGELERHWQQKARGAGKISTLTPAPPAPPAPPVGASNVLNLKEMPKLPVPPPMPRGGASNS